MIIMGNGRESLGSDSAERAFADAARTAGFTIQNSPSIRCFPPVLDKNGEPKKSVTTPDFLVIDHHIVRDMHVEVTKGGGNLPSKHAQQRVIAQAGITNYIIITGDQIEELGQADSPEKKRQLILDYFGWNDEDE